MKKDDWRKMFIPSIISWLTLGGVLGWYSMVINKLFFGIWIGVPVVLFVVMYICIKYSIEPEENLTVTLRHEPPTKISLNGGEIRLLFDYRNNRETGKIKMLYYNTYVLFNGNLLQDSLLRDNLQFVVPPKFSDTYKGWKKKEMPGCYDMAVPGTYTFILIIIYAVDDKTFITHDKHYVEVVP